MRIIRSHQTWTVSTLSRGGKEGCLQRLALKHGYRVGEISGVLGCSERYLRTVFLRDIGLLPKEWMRQERMVVARRMIAGGKDQSEVASDLGFASASNFRREFHQTYGTSPGRWRKRGNFGC